MNLRTYLKQNCITHKAFAETLDISPNYVSAIVSGKRKPSRWLACSVQRVTDGKVTAKSLRKKRNTDKINKQPTEQKSEE